MFLVDLFRYSKQCLMKNSWVLMGLLVGLNVLTGCQSTSQRGPEQVSEDLSYLAKTDIDTVADTHYQRIQSHIRSLASKLYKRNPKYCNAKEGIPACIASLFPDKETHPLTQQCKNGLSCIEAAFAPQQQQDRIKLLIIGIKQMVDASYNFKSSFYIIDEIDQQKLYNSARNIEIIVWRLKNKRDTSGRPIIISNATTGDVINLSYERLFGKMISIQDTLAAIMAEKNQRLLKNIIQRLATAVLLPV